MSMLTPNQIKTQTFPVVSRGTYRAADVDAFLQRVSYSYSDLLQQNTALKNKFAELSDLVKEYNVGKNAIATALVKAQALADQTTQAAKDAADKAVADANDAAEKLLREKRLEAERYSEEKKGEADRYYEKMHAQMQQIMNEAEAQSKQYAEDVNARASKIISDANAKAAMIVAAAYKDAQDAQKKTDEIIARAKVEMETTRRSIAAFRTDALSVLNELMPMIENISVDDFDAPDLFAQKTQIPDVTPEVAEAPKLSLDALFHMPEEPAAPAPVKEEAVEALPDFEPIEAVFNAASEDDDKTVAAAPSIPAAFDLDKTDSLPNIVEEPDLSAVEIETPAKGEQLTFDVPPEDHPATQSGAEPAPLFTYQTPKEDETPSERFKFHLTKNFDIFDD